MDSNDFKSKKVWAVVGSVHNHDKFAYKIYKFLSEKGYRVYGVDQSGENVDNEVTYKSLYEIPEKPDAVNMVVNPVKGIEYIDQAADMNIEYIWFQPGAENEAVLKRAEGYNMKIVHNSCVMVEF